MNNMLKKISLMTVMFFMAIMAMAQDATQETDFMRSNGKIYVVMAVVLTIVSALFIYVALLDKKISKLEKK